MQIGLSAHECAREELRRCLRQQAIDQIHGTLVEGAGGVAMLVAFDPAIRGVWRVPVDARATQGFGVHPGPVAIRVRQKRGPIGDGLIERRGGGAATGKGRHAPAATQNPLFVGVTRRVRRDDLQILRLC